MDVWSMENQQAAGIAMSLSTIHTRASIGIEAPAVTVETHITNGLPSLTIVGLPEKAVKESKERVRSALINAGFDFPMRRVTINLAPADLPKQGGRYDLAIALSILVASKQIPEQVVAGKEFLGELGLSGETRPVRGVVSAVEAASLSGRMLYLPTKNGPEAALVGHESILLCDHISLLCKHLLEGSDLPSCDAACEPPLPPNLPDLSEVVGQYRARRALEIAAAGGLNVLFFGPPGTGKSMLAQRLPGIMPDLNRKEMLDVAKINSLVHVSEDFKVNKAAPFRSPHHSATAVAMVGGGQYPTPGEISLAHNGVLFLDELPEFSRQVLEVLREPMETGEMHLSRANYATSFPARFQVIGAMNPCPCGYQGHPKINCTDTPIEVARYRKRLSGPLMDRFDMHVEVNFQSNADLLRNSSPGESSNVVKSRVLEARKRQLSRQGKKNALLGVSETRQVSNLQTDVQEQFIAAIEKLTLSARSAHRALRVAITIADLEGTDQVGLNHIMEALSYRKMDRQPV